jgi:hypothetical protein
VTGTRAPRYGVLALGEPLRVPLKAALRQGLPSVHPMQHWQALAHRCWLQALAALAGASIAVLPVPGLVVPGVTGGVTVLGPVAEDDTNCQSSRSLRLQNSVKELLLVTDFRRDFCGRAKPSTISMHCAAAASQLID